MSTLTSAFTLQKFISLQLLPPAIICYGLLIGLIFIWRGHRRKGYSLIVISSVCLYLLSLPQIAYQLAKPLQPAPLSAGAIAEHQVGAIVVLSGGNNYFTPEYNSVIISNTNLIRLRYAAFLAEKSHLPILISGASLSSKLPPAAETMAGTLQKLWGIKARWVETRSINTSANAKQSAIILKKNHIHRIWLVTSATHMPRAAASFREQGLEVTMAATDYIGRVELASSVFYVIPRASAFMRSYLCCYEYAGLLWYKMHGLL